MHGFEVRFPSHANWTWQVQDILFARAMLLVESGTGREREGKKKTKPLGLCSVGLTTHKMRNFKSATAAKVQRGWYYNRLRVSWHSVQRLRQIQCRASRQLQTDLNHFEVLLYSWNLRADTSRSLRQHAFSQPGLTAMVICTSQQSFQFQINSFTLLSCTVPGVHQWGTPDSIVRQNHDQRVSKFKRSGQRIWHAEKSSNQESTNKQQWSFESNLPSSDRKHNDGPCRQANHDVWFGLVKNACAQLGTEIQKRMRTLAQYGFAWSWRPMDATDLTGTEREASAHWLLESAAALGGPRSIGKVGQRTKSTRQTGRVIGSAWDEWSRALSLTHWPGGPFSTPSSEKENITAPMGNVTALISKFAGSWAWDP